jgi:hypothetical protein
MSKKPLPPQTTAAAQAAVDASAALSAVAQPLDNVSSEALRRFNPFMFTLTTDTKEMVDVTPCLDVIARDPGVAEHYFVIERHEAVQHFCSLDADKVLGPYQGPIYQDIKAAQAVLADTATDASALTPIQSHLVAVCMHQKLAAFALARERRRLAVLEAARLAHLDLVEKYMEDGMSEADAQRAATSEEEAAKASEAAENEDEGDQRAQAFVCLKNFPQTATDVMSLINVGLPVSTILTINSVARLGMRKEDLAKAAAAAAAAAATPATKGGKPAAVDSKKPDPKKAAGGGKGGKGTDEPSLPAVVESVSASLRREMAKMQSCPTQHPFLDVALWDYAAPTNQVTASAAPEDSTKPSHELAESETNIFAHIASRIVTMEAARHQYQQWVSNKVTVMVPPLVIRDAAKEAADAAAAAAREKEKADLAAKAQGGGKKVGATPAPKVGKTGGAATEPAPSTDALDNGPSALVPPPPPALPPLPATMAKLWTSPQPMLSPESMSHCFGHIVDGVVTGSIGTAAARVEGGAAGGDEDTCVVPRQGSVTTAAEDMMISPRAAASEALERAVQNAKDDVSDFLDYMFGVLDGNQEAVCAAIRDRRCGRPSTIDTLRSTDATSTERGDEVGSLSVGRHTYTLAHTMHPRGGFDAVMALMNPHHIGTIPTEAYGGTMKDIVAACMREAEGLNDDPTYCDQVVADRASLVQLLSAAELEERLMTLHAGADADLRSTATFSLPNGKQIVVCGTRGDTTKDADDYDAAESAAARRHRTLTSWHAFHGAATFPQYLQWLDYVEKEWLYYMPPPRDEDEEPPAEEEVPEEEEEEDEEQPEEYDDYGNLIEKPPRKKAKKIVLYDLEYIDVARQRHEALRRRQLLSLLGRLVGRETSAPLLTPDAVNVPKDEWMHAAHSHGAHVLHEDQQVLYPDDGSTVIVRHTTGNEETVTCRVYPAGVPIGKAFCGVERRCAPRCSKSDAAGGDSTCTTPRPTMSTSGEDVDIRTGVRGVVCLDGVVAATLEVFVEDEDAIKAYNTDVLFQEKSAQEAAFTAANSALAAPTVAQPSVGSKTPRGAKTGSAVAQTSTAASPDSLAPNGSATASRPGSTRSARGASASSRIRSAAPAPVLHASVTNWDGVTLLLSSAQGAIRLVPSGPVHLGDAQEARHVNVFDGQNVVPMLIAQEMCRSVLVDSACMQIEYVIDPSVTERTAPPQEGGNQDNRVLVQLYASGNMSSSYRGNVLFTRPDGARVLRSAGDDHPASMRVLSSVAVAEYSCDSELAVVRQRVDGWVMLTRDTGDLDVTFPDGTQFTTHAARTASYPGIRTAIRITPPQQFPVTMYHATDKTFDVSFVNQSRSAFVSVQTSTETHQSRTLVLSSIRNGLHVVVPLESPHLLHALPSPNSNVEYAMDLLFGGLRAEDASFCFHVTPCGEARARRKDDVYAPVPTDLTVRHTVEVFGLKENQRVDKKLEDVLVRRFGSSAFVPLYLIENPQKLPSHELQATTRAHGLGPLLPGATHRTAGDEQKKRSTAERMKGVLSFGASEVRRTAMLCHRIFIRNTDGSGLELCDPADRDSLLRDILTSSDLVYSDVLASLGTATNPMTCIVTCRSEPTQREMEQSWVHLNTTCQPAVASSSPRSVDQFIRMVSSLSGLPRQPSESHHGVAAVRYFSIDSQMCPVPPALSVTSVAAGLEERLPLARQLQQPTSEVTDHLSAGWIDKSGRLPMEQTIAALTRKLDSLRATSANAWASESGGVCRLSDVAPYSKQPEASSAPSQRPPPEHPQLHVNPTEASPSNVRRPKHTPGTAAGVAMTLSNGSRRIVVPQKLVATPASIEFGTLMEGFRYAAVIQLTNMGTQSCRFRVEVPASFASWLSVEYPKQPIAAGMSIPLTVEINGYQAPGPTPSTSDAPVHVTVAYEGGGYFLIPVTAFTRTMEERPVSQQVRGVRMVGPSAMRYVPGRH